MNIHEITLQEGCFSFRMRSKFTEIASKTVYILFQLEFDQHFVFPINKLNPSWV